MASLQCHKPNEKISCHQGHQEHSLGHKVSDMASSIFKGHGSHQGQGQGSYPGQGHGSYHGQGHGSYHDQGHGSYHDQGHGSYHGQGHGSRHGQGQTTQCYKDHGVAKTQTQYCHSQSQGHRPHPTMSHTSQGQCMSHTNGHQAQHHAPTTATPCQAKTKHRGQHKKRGLLRRMKDGISGDSSDGSSSDSESDNEKCGTRH